MEWMGGSWVRDGRSREWWEGGAWGDEEEDEDEEEWCEDEGGP